MVKGEEQNTDVCMNTQPRKADELMAVEYYQWRNSQEGQVCTFKRCRGDTIASPNWFILIY